LFKESRETEEDLGVNTNRLYVNTVRLLNGALSPARERWEDNGSGENWTSAKGKIMAALVHVYREIQ
jgi:hypothetical protein